MPIFRLFDPSHPDPTSSGMVSNGKTTTYACVYAFTDRLLHLTAARGEQPVVEAWSQCLQGPALVWHSQILTPEDRTQLQYGPVKTITDKLIERFKPAYVDALQWTRHLPVHTVHDS
ncbi:hypothetical protein CDV31_014929 [Fusarium ambrosium]|uniref:Uncharacterized protein n=1 Tax=Fusarium ambrosium TaxID=131363 RepID=A0A428ST54_9HYPO|nr:hypothetical protein CDV31_014929 [Fusarium ambrosium]